jgi:TatA/E family protein of Tat protein translocase
VLGSQDILLALALGVFFFGAKKLPELSRSVGQAMSEFKKGLSAGSQEETPSTTPAKTEAAPEARTTDGKPSV